MSSKEIQTTRTFKQILVTIDNNNQFICINIWTLEKVYKHSLCYYIFEFFLTTETQLELSKTIDGVDRDNDNLLPAKRSNIYVFQSNNYHEMQ